VGRRCGHRYPQTTISEALLTKNLSIMICPSSGEYRRFVSVELKNMHPKGMKASSTSLICTLLLSGCFDSNNTRSLQQHTADATAAAKRDAGAITRGVVEGLTRKGPTDINTASAQDLEKLPDVTAAEAQAIIIGRPYENTSQLVKRHILSKAHYNKIRAQIGVK
jgi:DNA uptake protein ComE-like DNA-binding protein